MVRALKHTADTHKTESRWLNWGMENYYDNDTQKFKSSKELKVIIIAYAEGQAFNLLSFKKRERKALQHTKNLSPVEQQERNLIVQKLKS